MALLCPILGGPSTYEYLCSNLEHSSALWHLGRDCHILHGNEGKRWEDVRNRWMKTNGKLPVNAADGFLTMKETVASETCQWCWVLKFPWLLNKKPVVNKGGKNPSSPLRRIHHFKQTHGLIETADLEPHILHFLHSIEMEEGIHTKSYCCGCWWCCCCCCSCCCCRIQQ